MTVLARAVLIAAVCLASRAAFAEECTPNPRFDKSGPAPKRGGADRAKKLRGKTAKQVIAALGEPSCKSKTLWRYYEPEGCAYEKTVISLWWKNGKVSRINAVHWFTGQECM